MSDVLERRWGFVRRWCAPVRCRLLVRRLAESRARVPSSMCCTGIEVVLPKTKSEATPTKLNAIREALVLLALIARVDHSAFQFVLVEFCDMELTHQQMYTETDEFRNPRFVLGLEGLEEEVKWISEMLSNLLTGSDSAPSWRFSVAVEQVVSYGKFPLEPIDIRVFVVVNPYNYGSSAMVNAVLAGICEARGSQDDWTIPIDMKGIIGFPACASLHQSTPTCAFVIEKIALYLDTYPTLVKVEGFTDSIMKLNAGTIPTPDELLGNFDAALSGRRFGKLFRELLCEEHVTPALDHVRISSLVSYPELFGRVCSAVWAAQTTKSLHLHFDDIDGIIEMDALMWMHMGYALFSSHNSITHVVLEQVELTTEYMKEMTAILEADDPIKYLFSSGESHVSLPIYSQLKRGTAITILQMHPDETIAPEFATWELENDIDSVRVIDVFESEEGSPEASLLVPGYGLCNVSVACLFPAHKFPSSRGSSITSLSIEFVNEPDSASGLIQLLQLIGAPLERLKLTLPATTSLALEDVFVSCPNLKALTVKGVGVSAAALIDAYSNNKAQLEELDCNFTDLPLLVRELADQESCLAQTLQRVAFPIPRSWIDIDKPLVLMAIDAMLERNRVLEFVHIALPGSRVLIGSSRHDDSPLPVVARPFPLTCRLAFLSVFLNDTQFAKKRTKTASTTKSLGTIVLDHHVLGVIFAFAAECVRRRVFFESTNAQRTLITEGN